MLLKTLVDYDKEIARVQASIDSTNSEFLKNDYGKYMKRLKRERRQFARQISRKEQKNEM